MTRHAIVDSALRAVAALLAAALVLFLLNAYLVFYQSWPEFTTTLHWLGVTSDPSQAVPQYAPTQSILQLVLYCALALLAIFLVQLTPLRTLRHDGALYHACADYVIRAAFWAVLLVGVVDFVLSFLRVEGFLAHWFGEEVTSALGRPVFRGVYVHTPLLVAALVIAHYVKPPGFIWLAFLVVLAEFQVVILRFVFSYEQVFMGDLVRFWYAALFLFASSYTLVHEGHVRVDVLYANFTERAKATTNAVGALVLGLPVCWTILIYGMSSRNASIISPLLGFEIAQSGYGMYVKYLMAGFLLVYAVSMALQFISVFLNSLATIRRIN